MQQKLDTFCACEFLKTIEMNDILREQIHQSISMHHNLVGYN